MKLGLFFLMQRDEGWSEPGGSLLPLHHPVDLAEQLAVLDVVSGGRLDVGIGRGGSLRDYQTFRSERTEARLRSRAWGTGRGPAWRMIEGRPERGGLGGPFEAPLGA